MRYYRILVNTVLPSAILTVCTMCSTKTSSRATAENLDERPIESTTTDLTGILWESDSCTPLGESEWALIQPGLYRLFNSINPDETWGAWYMEPEYEDETYTCYPMIFHVKLDGPGLYESDSLLYDWNNDTITCINFPDIDNNESMIWSTTDTIYIREPQITRQNHGIDIKCTLYDREVIEELKNWNKFKNKFDNEVNEPCMVQGRIMSYFYAKIIIQNGKVKKHLLHNACLPPRQHDRFSARQQ